VSAAYSNTDKTSVWYMRSLDRQSDSKMQIMRLVTNRQTDSTANRGGSYLDVEVVVFV